jgi:hypothetical protein
VTVDDKTGPALADKATHQDIAQKVQEGAPRCKPQLPKGRQGILKD